MKLTDSNSAFAGSNAVRTIASSSSTSNQFMVYSDTQLSRILSGTGVSLVKNGLGTLTLSAANDYTGNTTISAGTLSIINTSALPGYNTNGRFYVAPNATLAVYNAVTDAEITTLRNTNNFAANANLGFDTTSGNRTYPILISNTSSGALGVVKLGTNTLTITSANTYTGQTSVLVGTLSTTTNNIIPDSSPVNIASGAILNLGGSDTIATLSGAGTLNTASQLTFNSSNNATFTGVISSSYYNTVGGNIAVYKTGTGTQTFSGATVRFGDSINGVSVLRHDNGGIQILGGTFTQTITSGHAPRNYQMGIGRGATTSLTVAQSGIMNVKGLMLGENDAVSNNTINLSSGGTIINAGDTWFSGASGTMNIDGGFYSTQLGLEIGGGTNTLAAVNNLNISNGGIFVIPNGNLTMGRSRVSVNTINLNSNGTLSATYVNAVTGVNATSNIVNFNGGIYSPVSNSIINSTSSFLTYRIKSGGATFNIPSGWTNSFNPNLLQDASSTGGGLVKTGAGQLTFGGTGSTYTGQLSVLEGTFSVNSINNNSANGVFGNSTKPIVLGSSGKTVTLQYTGTGGTCNKGFIFQDNSTAVIDITLGSSNLITSTGDISGGGNFIKNGIGQLGFNGNNTYTGTSTLNAGIFQVGSDTALGTGTIILNGGSIRSNQTGTTKTLSNPITLNSATTFPNATNEKTLVFAGPVTMVGGTIALTVVIGASVATESLTISGPIGDGGNNYQLVKNGAGRLILTGQNTFTGPVVIQAGNCAFLYPTIGDIRTTGTGIIQFTSDITTDISSSIRNNTQVIRVNTNGQNVTFASLLSSNSGGLTKTGTGTLTLSTTPVGTNPNGIRGTITSNAGELTFTGTLSTASRIYVSNGAGTSGTISVSGDLIQTANPGGGPRNFQIGPTAGVTGTVNVYSGGTLRSAAGGGMMLGENNGGTGRMNIYGGTVDIGTGQFWFSGPTATLSMSAGTFNASGAMYFSGGTGPQSIFNMSGGTAAISNSIIIGQPGSGTATLNLDGGLLSTTSTVINTVSAHVFNFNGGTLRVTGNSTITTTPTLLVKSGGCIYDQTANTSTINGILSSQGADGGLTKLGAGVLALNAINVYTGTTAISAGTLRVLKKISGTGTDASFSQANFTLSTLGVTFNSIPNIGDTYKLFPGSTVNTYGSITLTGATGRTATYDSSNSTLTIA